MTRAHKERPLGEITKGSVMSRKLLLSTALVTGLSGAWTAPAIAQSGQNAGVILDEIIVTATRRAVSVQDVPVAVSAFSADQIERSGIRDVRELQQIAPSLVAYNSQSETAGAVIRIRGIGTTGDNAGLESSVGIFIDGVYRNRSAVGLTELGSIERIEVLRGPQGTLFGRNTSAGLVSIITKGPSDEFEGYGEFEYGNYNHLRIAAGASAPLSDVAGVRLDAVYTKRDGLIEDALNDREYNTRDRYLIRGQARFEPTEDISIRLIADYTDRNEDCCAAVTLVRGPTAAFVSALGGTVLDDPFGRQTTVDDDHSFNQDVQEYGVSAEVNWDFEDATLTSITAYRDWEVIRGTDVDYTDIDILFRDDDGFQQSFETFTQEVRLQGQYGKLDYLFGLFYADETLDLTDAIKAGSEYEEWINALVTSNPFSGFYSQFTGLPPGSVFIDGQGAQRDNFVTDSSSIALFTHNTLELTDNLDLTGGLRWTREKKDLTASLTADNPACGPTLIASVNGAAAAGLLDPASVPTILGLPCLPFFNPLVDGDYDGSRTEKEWSGVVKLSYTVNDDALVYASFSRGYKAGGFNLDRAGFNNPLLGFVPSASDLEFEPEFVDSYELGGKFTVMDGRGTVNMAAFMMDITDFQLNTFTGTGFIVSNLESADSWGMEVESQFQATENLTLRLGATYAVTKYGDDISNTVLAGRNLTNAPEWTYTAGFNYERDFGGILGFINMDLRSQSEANTGSDLDREKVQKPFTLVNGSVGIAEADRMWAVELWGRNIFDEDYIQVGFDAPLQGSGTGPGSTASFNAFLGEPRTFGVRLRGNF